jgi:hypothetical protein
MSWGVENLSSALFIGNSFFHYNNSLQAMMASATPKRPALRSVPVTISGSGFGWHDVESYFRPNAMGSCSFTADNRIVMNK